MFSTQSDTGISHLSIFLISYLYLLLNWKRELKIGISGKGLTHYQTIKFSTEPRLNTFGDEKLDTVQMMVSVFDKIENIVGKGENAGYQHFLLFS